MRGTHSWDTLAAPCRGRSRCTSPGCVLSTERPPPRGKASRPAGTPRGLLLAVGRQHQHQLPKHTLPPARQVRGHEARQVQRRPRRIAGRTERAGEPARGPRAGGARAGRGGHVCDRPQQLLLEVLDLHLVHRPVPQPPQPAGREEALRSRGACGSTGIPGGTQSVCASVPVVGRQCGETEARPSGHTPVCGGPLKGGRGR